MAASPEPVTVTRTVSLDTDVDRAWDAVSSPAELGEWLGGPVELDVRPGGVGHADLPDGPRSLLVTAVEPGERLSWLWSDEDGEVSSVELSLVPDGELVRLTVVERSVVTTQASITSWRFEASSLASVRA